MSSQQSSRSEVRRRVLESAAERHVQCRRRDGVEDEVIVCDEEAQVGAFHTLVLDANTAGEYSWFDLEDFKHAVRFHCVP